MDSIGAFSTNSKGCGYPNECNNTKNPVRGVCPEKWHLPSQQEWYDLSTYNSSTISGDLSSAGERLKSANGWFSSGNGDNTYGFSVLPAGIGSEENYSRSGEKTCFGVHRIKTVLMPMEYILNTVIVKECYKVP